MKRIRIFACAAVIALTATQSTRSAPPQRPPPLTFEKHVDYVGWYRKQTEKPGKPNAYDALVKLIDSDNSKYELPPKGYYNNDALREPFEDLARGGIVWNEAEQPQIAKYLEEISLQLSAFKRTTSIEHCWRTIPADAERIKKKGVLIHGHCRHATRALIVDGWRKSPQLGKRLTDAHEYIAKHIKQLRQMPDGVPRLMASAHVRILCDSIRAALHAELLGDDELKRTYDALWTWSTVPIRYDVGLCLDWAEELDTLQFAFPGGKRSRKNYKIMADEFAPLILPERGADPKAVLKIINDSHDRLIDLVGGPPSRKNWEQIEDHLYQIHGDRELLDFSYPGVLGALGRGYLLHLEAETEWRGTLLALAIHRHHLKEGKWPAQLNELKIPELKRLRTDPFAGRDFIHRLEDGEPLLYSVAVDGIDDNATHTGRWEGILDKGVDYVFLPYHEPHRIHFKDRNPKSED